jgi:hypothetical protein
MSGGRGEREKERERERERESEKEITAVAWCKRVQARETERVIERMI